MTCSVPSELQPGFLYQMMLLLSALKFVEQLGIFQDEGPVPPLSLHCGQGRLLCVTVTTRRLNCIHCPDPVGVSALSVSAR